MAEVQGLGKALEALKTAFMDLTELEVVTYTGSVETAVANGKINWAGIMSEGGKTDGKVKLVAASLIKFDGDSYVFRTSDDFTGRRTSSRRTPRPSRAASPPARQSSASSATP